jgi:phage terminase large subunit GpA-like protein
MRAFSDARYRRVVMVTSAQTAKTESFLDIIGERLDNRPAPILYVGPSKEFVTDQFEPRLRSLFEQSKSLQSKIIGGLDGKRQKKTLKRVNGTTLRLAHAGSSTALKSDPASMALVDEYDEMLKNVNKQGDPLGLVEARGDTYADFVAGIVSTPSLGMIETEIDPVSGLELWKAVRTDNIEDVPSPIWRLWQSGTRHHWCWRCPHCHRYFVPRFNLLDGFKNLTPLQARRSAFVRCFYSDCGGVIEERHKEEMNATGRMVAPGQSVDADGNVIGAPPESSTLSFWVSGLASPFVTIGQRVETYLTALRSNESDKLQTAINSQFGELYVDGGGDVPPWEHIFDQRLPYKAKTVPDGVRYLTCGVDVQKNRLIFVVRGWGRYATSWLIVHGELHGNTADGEVWDNLSEFLQTPIDNHMIKLCYVDSGFRPGKREGVPVNRVYEFCRRHRRFVFPTKGSSHIMLRPFVRSHIEVTQQGSTSKYGLELLRLETDHWKSFVHERLRWPREQPGAWYINNDVDENYCRQLVSEVRVVGLNGKPQWIVRARENHFLDAEAMAAAAAFQLNVQHLRGGGGKMTPPPPSAAAEQTAEPVEEMTPAPPPLSTRSPIAKRSRFADLASRLNQ